MSLLCPNVSAGGYIIYFHGLGHWYSVEALLYPATTNSKIPLQPSAVDSASAPKEPEQIREEIGATGAKWCQP